MLKISDLTAGYEKDDILNDVAFEAGSSEITGIIGPNGSGKTTLIRSITGIIQSRSGKIEIDGKDVSRIPRNEFARKTAVVSQTIDPVNMSIGDFVLMGRIPYFKTFQFFETQKDLEIARKYMEYTGIYCKSRELMTNTSGGERQLAVIARALCQEPDLLLMDEPVSHLDIRHQVEILDLIKNLTKSSGIAVVIVLHDLNLASQYCDNLVLLDGGSVFSNGKPWEVLTYENIERVYRTKTVVKQHPFIDVPQVFFVPGYAVEDDK